MNPVFSAREKVVDNSTRAELVTVPKITAKVEDHSCTWRDVVIKDKEEGCFAELVLFSVIIMVYLVLNED